MTCDVHCYQPAHFVLFNYISSLKILIQCTKYFEKFTLLLSLFYYCMYSSSAYIFVSLTITYLDISSYYYFSSSLSKQCRKRMDRSFLTFSNLKPETKNWIAIIQVAEKLKRQASKAGNPYQKMILRDTILFY